MKKIIFLFIAIVIMNCSTTEPYKKKTNLPDKTIYYEADKQFSIQPDWFWKFRPNEDPETYIGHSYIQNKAGKAIVIGEYIANDGKYLIAQWNDYGYFFIDKAVFNFSKKYQEYLIPLNYCSDSIKQYGSDYHLIAYYENNSSPTIKYIPTSVMADATRSKLNLKTILKLTISRSLLMINLNPFGTKYRDIINKTYQIAYNNGFSNEFLKFTSCPLLEDFFDNSLKKNTLFSINCFAVKKIGIQQYTNQYGMMFRGVVYQTEFVIIKWGQVFYALPCK